MVTAPPPWWISVLREVEQMVISRASNVAVAWDHDEQTRELREWEIYADVADANTLIVAGEPDELSVTCDGTCTGFLVDDMDAFFAHLDGILPR